MMYGLTGITYELYKELHDHFMPHTIIKASQFDHEANLYNIELSNSDTVLSVCNGDITIQKNGNWFIIDKEMYNLLIII